MRTCVSGGAALPHDLFTIGQEHQCVYCRRRWDFDESPDDNEVCDERPPVNSDP